MSTLSSANVTDVNLVLKERTHMRLCINMLVFTHNLGNWLMARCGGGGPRLWNGKQSLRPCITEVCEMVTLQCNHLSPFSRLPCVVLYIFLQEIIAISCSWCKAAYHNKVSCFMMQQIEEPCLLGVHADGIIPPSWIIKLPQKVHWLICFLSIVLTAM